MFGTYRLLLALLVLLKHFKATEVFSGLAVWGFFLLSGFLITGALNTRYQFCGTGLVEFSVNRALRIFPTYWLSVILAFLSIGLLGHLVEPRAINSALGVPDNVLEWISAVFILGGTFLGLGRLETSPSPSSWAVDVEILMYAASALWLSRTWKGAKLTLLVCTGLFPLLYLASKWLVRNDYPDLAGSLIYSFLPAALIPYAYCACIWHLRERFKKPEKPVAHLVTAGVAFLICGSLVSRLSVTVSFFVALPLMGYITWLLSNMKMNGAHGRTDAFLGHMAYPVYLLHWVGNHVALGLGVALGVSITLFMPDGNGLLQTSVAGFTLTVIVTLLMSALVAWCFEAPIDARRRKWSSQLSAAFFSTKRVAQEQYRFRVFKPRSFAEALIASLLVLSMTQGVWVAAGASESMLKAALEIGIVALFVVGVTLRLRTDQTPIGMKLIVPFFVAAVIGLIAGAIEGASFLEGLFYVRLLTVPLLFLLGVLNVQLDMSAARRLMSLVIALLLLQLPLFAYKWMVIGVEEKHWIGGLSQTAGQLGLIFPMLVLSMLLLLYLYKGGWTILLVMIYAFLPVVNEKRAVVVMLPFLIAAAFYVYARLSSRHLGEQIGIPRITIGKFASLSVVCITVWISSVTFIPSLQCGSDEPCPVQLLKYGKDYLLRDYSSPMNYSDTTTKDNNTNIQLGRLKLIQESIETLADKGLGTLIFGLGGGAINPSPNIGPDRADILYKKFGVRGTYSYGLMLLWEGGIASVMAAAGFFVLIWLMLIRQLARAGTHASVLFGNSVILMVAVLAFDFFGYSTTGWQTHTVTPFVFTLVAIFLRHGYPEKVD